MCFLHSGAQKGYSVIYDRMKLSDSISGMENTPVKLWRCRLVFNDSASFFYNYGYGSASDAFARKKRFGKQLFPHSWYHYPASHFLAEGTNIDVFKKQRLIYDTADRFNWILIGGERTIEGFVCKAALSINKKGDSTLAFYTLQIPKPYGPAMFTGLPGVILEVYDQQYNWHMWANKIVAGEYEITLPKKLDIVSRAAHNNNYYGSGEGHSKGVIDGKGNYFRKIIRPSGEIILLPGREF